MGKGGGFIFLLIVSTVLMLGIVSAQENVSEDAESKIIEELGEEYTDEELEVSEGITPDSAFYFIDDFFDRFADEVKVRQEKIAEIRAMIQEGNFEAAREALKRYKEYADNLEREISPEQRDDARRSAAAIYNVLKSFESQIPEGDRDEFFHDIIEREGRIVTAAEIAGKIKELCETLSELDPLEYSRVCKTNDDSPRWQQDLHKDLTEEQRKEAEAFFEIMFQCFETSGGTCRCEDISITAFANKCSVIAPLAYACDVENNEAACDKMDSIEDEEPIEDLLPDYLREVLFRLENRYEDERFDNYAPRECREAGATTREECEKIMFRLNAPPECVKALERGEIDISNERESREVCERLMFELEAPFECKEAGLTDFRECGKLMFRLNAPPECLAAGLTGEYRSDEKKCRDLVGGDFGPRDQGPVFNFNCAGIENPEERLACYDQGISNVHDYDVRYEETKERERQCAQSCLAEGGAWDFSGGVCNCHFDRYEYEEPTFGDYDDYPKEDYNQPPYDCSVLDCFERYYCDPYAGCVQDDGVFEEPPYDCSVILCQEGSYCDPYIGCISFEEPEPTTETNTTGSVPTTEPEEPEPELEQNTTGTGAVITGNAFLDYYFR